MEEENTNWSESVEDLVHGGDVDKAISLLESLISHLQTLNPSSSSNLQLSLALFDLSKLYNSKGFSLKADDAHSRSLLLRERELKIAKKEFEEDGIGANGTSPPNGSSDDDWEAIADCAPDELLSTKCLPGVSKLSLEETKAQTPKRRGRGTFSYMKDGLYSDQQSECSTIDDPGNEDALHSSDGDTEVKTSLEASKCVQFPFSTHVLDENDILLSSIPSRDLEPPRRRPETSASTAKRLIAHGMGIKLPSTAFGSKELRKQEEEARRNRIVSRQNMRDDAWGDDK